MPEALPPAAERILDHLLHAPQGAPWRQTSFGLAQGFGKIATLSLASVKGTEADHEVLLLIDWIVGFSEGEQLVGVVKHLASPARGELLTCQNG